MIRRFGWGIQVCPARRFATTEISHLLALRVISFRHRSNEQINLTYLINDQTISDRGGGVVRPVIDRSPDSRHQLRAANLASCNFGRSYKISHALNAEIPHAYCKFRYKYLVICNTPSRLHTFGKIKIKKEHPFTFPFSGMSEARVPFRTLSDGGFTSCDSLWSLQVTGFRMRTVR